MSIQTGARLAELRKRRGYSQEALAEKLGLSRQAISKWERGESSPDTDTLIELARLYGVSLDELIDHTPAEPPVPPKKSPEAEAQAAAPQPAADPAREAPPATGRRKKKPKAPPLYPGISSKLLKFPFPLVVIALYLLAGFTANLWHPLWLLFLLLPAYYHFALFAARASSRRSFLQGLPIFEGALLVFLALGFWVNAWKWAWIFLVAALIYHWYIGSLWNEKT